MSLINQMLRDLDERREEACAPVNVHPYRRGATKDVPWYAQRRTLAWSGGGLLVALLSVAIFWEGGEGVAYSKKDGVSTHGLVTDPVSIETIVPVGLVATRDPGNQVSAAAGGSVGGEGVPDAAIPAPTLSPAVSAVPMPSLRKETKPAGKTVPADMNDAAANLRSRKDVAPASSPATESSRYRIDVTGDPERSTAVTARRALPDEVERVSADIGAAESTKQEKPPHRAAVKRPVHPPERQADDVYQEARKLLDQGLLAESEANLRRVLEMENAHLEARQLLSLVLLRGSRLTEASALLTEGLNIAPHHPKFAKLKARVLIAQGELADAIEVLESIASGGEMDPERLAILAAVHQQYGDHARAVKTYRELLRYSSQSGVSWAGLAISLDAQGEREAAVRSYQRALGFASLAPEVRTYARHRIIALTNHD